MRNYKIVFLPDKKTISVPGGTSILSAALEAGINIDSGCGGDGVCGRCKVIVKKGKIVSQPSGRLTDIEKQKSYVLSCQAIIESDAVIFIPEESRLESLRNEKKDRISRLKGIFSGIQNVENNVYFSSSEFNFSPLVKKIHVKLPVPNLQDNLADLERIERFLLKNRDQNKNFISGISLLRQLPEILRSSDWDIAVTLGKVRSIEEILQVEPAKNGNLNYGVVVDIGTTTISAQLVNLVTKEVLGTKVSCNRQASYGADVITRIIYSQKKNGLEKLHHAVIDTINQIIEQFVTENNISLNDINCILCSGNTTMIHLLLRIDPSWIRKEPYIPALNFPPVLHAASVGIRINTRGLLFCVPGVASYVGGDITSGVLESGIYKSEKVCLLIDIGTNGEIALGNRDWILTVAASAGPAFEGSTVASGMRATPGAIQRLKISKENKIDFKTIGDSSPLGICGSGYIDLLSEMLINGIMDRNGKLKVKSKGYNDAFIIVPKKISKNKKDIIISEADIDNLKRSKGAIYAAVMSLLKHVNMDFSQVERIYISGGFGNCLDVESAINIGLLADIDREKFSFIGNSSLNGARKMILSESAFEEANRIASKMTYLELSKETGYMEEYIAALFFPHTDLSRFPKVKLKS